MRWLLAGLLVLTACGRPASAQPTESLDAVVRQLAAAHTHGERDNSATVEERVALLEAGGLQSFCLEVVVAAQQFLADRGFDARHVALVALHPDADGIYQGHHVIEVWHPDRERWVIVDIDYGVMFDQTAASLPDGRVTPEPLEPDARDTEWAGGYPLVADGVGVVVDATPRFDPVHYTDAERAVLVAQGWLPG